MEVALIYIAYKYCRGVMKVAWRFDGSAMGVAWKCHGGVTKRALEGP